jgi:3-hydroxyacyl-CoA dehydrogenase
MAEDDRAGQFLWHHHAFYLAYASQRVPEITDTLVNIDNAMRWGFGHEMGPFQIWDALGVAATIAPFEAAGYPVADWVKGMVGAGHATFYQYDASGLRVGYYDVATQAYAPLKHDPRVITVEGLRAQKITTAISPDAGTPDSVRDNLRRTSTGEIASNGSAAILDMGDGVALLEFHSKQNAIDDDLIAMGYNAVERLEKGQFNALVVGNDGQRFSVGFNLFLAVMAVQSGQLDSLERGIRALQGLADAMRYASRPVVTAPFDLALGGGTELMFGGTQIVAHVELYAGLVEFGVGIIPAGGGCKEMLRRVLNPVMQSHPNADPLPHLQKIFEQLATAKVSETGAKAAREMGLLTPCDRIVMNRDHLLYEAKRTALYLADGYVPRQREKIYAAGRDAYAALLTGIQGFREQGLASQHDALIARTLAYVLTGGALSEPGWVDEQVILDLEREGFMRLVQEPKSVERISHMLQTNKALRN